MLDNYNGKDKRILREQKGEKHRRGQKLLCQSLIYRNVKFNSRKYKINVYFMALAKYPLAQRYLLLTSVRGETFHLQK